MPRRDFPDKKNSTFWGQHDKRSRDHYLADIEGKSRPSGKKTNPRLMRGVYHKTAEYDSMADKTAEYNYSKTLHAPDHAIFSTYQDDYAACRKPAVAAIQKQATIAANKAVEASPAAIEKTAATSEKKEAYSAESNNRNDDAAASAGLLFFVLLVALIFALIYKTPVCTQLVIAPGSADGKARQLE